MRLQNATSNSTLALSNYRKFAAMKWTAFIFLFVLTGCSSPFTVTLWRSGGVAEERYAVDQDGVGTKTVEMPIDSETIKTYKIDKVLVSKIGTLLHDSTKSLLAVELNSRGNEMTSGITIDEKNVHHEMTWADVDPPILNTPVLDSLYHLMLVARQQMTSP